MYDVLVIGGGPAGLTTAVTLARQQHSVLVLDSGNYRNSRSKHMHNVPTWDHRDPADFRAAGRRDMLENYSTISYAEAEVGTARHVSDSGNGKAYFELIEADGGQGRSWQGHKLVLAVGSVDIYPDELPGYGDCWGRGIYHCLFCHGYEERGGTGSSAGVLAIQQCASAPHALHMARNSAQLVERVVIYTNADPTLRDQIQTMLDGEDKTKGTFFVDDRKLASVALAGGTSSKDGAGSGIVLSFEEDGASMVKHSFIAHNPRTKLKGPFASQLGLELAPNGDIKVTPPFQQTTVRGVFAAGDCQSPFKAVPTAISSGSMSAVGVSAQLQAERHGHQGMF